MKYDHASASFVAKSLSKDVFNWYDTASNRVERMAGGSYAAMLHATQNGWELVGAAVTPLNVEILYFKRPIA